MNELTPEKQNDRLRGTVIFVEFFLDFCFWLPKV